MTRAAFLLIAACLAALLGACQSSNPWYPIRYSPMPVEVAVSADAVAGSQARVLVSVLGVARASSAEPDRVLVRLRVENLGTVDARVAPEGFSLVSADLSEFEAPRVTGAPAPIRPGGAATVDAAFPLPARVGVGGIDWGGLNLRFALEFEGRRVTTGATFTRTGWPYGP